MHKLPAERYQVLEKRLDKIRDDTLKKVGEKDARYIRNIVRVQRICEISGRITMVLGFIHPLFWVVGVLSLALSKILDNMEIGHNVMHGQYNWMNDPQLNSKTFEWDNVCSSESWKHTHNHIHHTYTNIIGKDRDFGYGFLRMSDDYRWKPSNIFQFFLYVPIITLFEWAVGVHELMGRRIIFKRKKESPEKEAKKKQITKDFLKKISQQTIKDYILFPIVSGPMFLPVLAGNFIANIIRNLWAATVIFCGHFTEDIYTFEASECENETRGEWYYRQMLGSSNFTGPKWVHILSGHLSCQIEHHLFPDMPSSRYLEIAPKVQELSKEFGIQYNSGPLISQYATVIKRILKYSLPSPEKTKVVTITAPR